MFPNKEYDIFATKNIFGSFKIEQKELDEISKKIYNYIDYDTALTLTSIEKERLVYYYEFLMATYFTQLDKVLNYNTNDILFSYEQWNILTNYLKNYQSFNKDYFIRIYNTFIKEQFNKVYKIEENNFNEYIEKLNKIYFNNKFLDDSQIFDLINIDKFNESLKEILDNYIKNLDLNVVRIKIIKEAPQSMNTNKTHLIMKKGG